MSRLAIPIVLFLALASSPAARAQEFPLGFKTEPVATGFAWPIGLALLPDGRAVVAEQFSGLVKIVNNGQVSVMGLVANLDTSELDRGLLSIAIDPQFPARPYLYAFYNRAGGGIRLSMYTLQTILGQLVMAAEYRILDDVLDLDPGHNGGCLRFGPDGMLYVSLGDDYDFCMAQDPNVLNGAMLRLDVQALPLPGSGPAPKSLIAAAGNPFVGAGGNISLVWAYGLRNPFRFQVDPLTGALLVTDVGEATWEEVDSITQPGMNMGWPFYEGPALFPYNCGPPTPNLSAPVFSVPHPLAHALIAIAAYRNPPAPSALAFGTEFEGDFFFTDFDYGYIQRIRPGSSGAPWTIAPPVAGQIHPDYFGAYQTHITDAALGADGAIYFLRYFASGGLTRLVPTTRYPGNGSDCEIRVSKNGQPDPRANGIHDASVGDTLTISCLSPGGSLVGAECALFAEAIPPGLPLGALTIPGETAVSIWQTFSAFPVFFGFGMGSPVLAPDPGYVLAPLVVQPWISGLNISILLQLYVIDPGRNAYGIGVSRAEEFRLH